MKHFQGFLYYKSEIQAQMLLESATFARGAHVSLPSLSSPLKSHLCTTFLQYLGKYAFVRRATRRFWKVPWQNNPNLLNKWHLNFACAYLNTQESSPFLTPLKRLQNECRPRGYLVNQCSAQQSRSALSSFSQYRFHLGGK
ncbi:conserved hypothetical protein [Trichinella spiralis]|uniref:hypothetical protein n=1 Tax=Trichinella spiralis TaxID=6334 RepID=UPI0001EFE7A0|nr:conserved hypothetical protein [Trichinella spiralis]